MYKSILILPFFVFVSSFAQLDTSRVYSEIRSLTTPESTNDYWIRLDSCDQDLGTLSNPVRQTENLLKTCSYFLLNGFEMTQNLAKDLSLTSQPAMHAQIIWRHNPIWDLTYYTAPLMMECSKYYPFFNGEDYDHLFESIFFVYPDDNKLKDSLLMVFREKSYKSLELNKITALANEYIDFLHSENYTIEGTWLFATYTVDEKKVPYPAYLYRTDSGNYYWGNRETTTAKLIKLEIPDSANVKYQFYTSVDGSYFEIEGSGDLVFKKINGEIIRTYKKWQ